MSNTMDQTIKAYENEKRTQILLGTLNDVKSIMQSKEFTNDEKAHLIESTFIVEKAELNQLEDNIEVANGFVQPMYCNQSNCACESSDAPEGQLTIFDFIGQIADSFEESFKWDEGNPFGSSQSSEEKDMTESEAVNAIFNGLPDEIADGVKTLVSEFADALQSAVKK